MESYGEILRKKREEKGIEIETAARDTTISRKYIEAMEKEREQDFPGEPYLIGFLKNYSDYLEADREEVLKLYNAKRIQETPVPVQLLEKHRPKWVVPLVVCSVLVFLAAAAIWLYYIILDVPGKIAEKEARLAESVKVHSYRIGGEIEKHRLYKGDQLMVPQREDENKFEIVTVSGCIGKLVLDTPSGKQVVDFGESRDLDINGDGRAEINLYLEDVSDRAENYGAQVRIFLTDTDLALSLINSNSEKTQEEINEEIEVVSDSSKRGTVIHETNSSRTAFPFTVEIVFRGACFFRYRIDNDDYIEAYYRSGETLTLGARNGFRFWMSNSNAVSIRVLADSTQKELDIGRAGEVKVQDLKWIFEDNTYKIALIDLD
ncbi:MAG: helix-turn-helix domain-containing protein [Treponema sp.]|nr:helix-turn-helix domain-containing protein [Treponema sp.]